MNNPRLPYAAKTLISQVKAKYEDVQVFSASEPDGLGVRRAIRVEGEAATWLAPLLKVLDDPRIVGYSTSDDGVTVTFTDTRRADDRQDFPLDAAEQVVGAQVVEKSKRTTRK